MHEMDREEIYDSLEFHLVNPTREEDEASRRELEKQRSILDPYIEVFVDGFLSHTSVGINYTSGARELAAGFIPWKESLEQTAGARGSAINDAVRTMNLGNIWDYAERKLRHTNGNASGLFTRGNLAYLRGCAQLAQMKISD